MKSLDVTLCNSSCYFLPHDGGSICTTRFELNRTQQEVAAQLGVTRFTVSRWEQQEEVPRVAELAFQPVAIAYRLVKGVSLAGSID